MAGGSRLLCTIVLIAIGLLISYGGNELHRRYKYIESTCQVIKSNADNWNCNGRNKVKCYRPVWTVLYDRPDVDAEPLEANIPSKSMLSLTDAISQIKKYQINHTYTCYGNEAKKEVLWKRPNRRALLIGITVGLLLIPTAFGTYLLYHNLRKRIRRRKHLATHASPTDVAEADGQKLENVVKTEDELVKLPTAV